MLNQPHNPNAFQAAILAAGVQHGNVSGDRGVEYGPHRPVFGVDFTDADRADGDAYAPTGLQAMSTAELRDYRVELRIALDDAPRDRHGAKVGGPWIRQRIVEINDILSARESDAAAQPMAWRETHAQWLERRARFTGECANCPGRVHADPTRCPHAECWTWRGVAPNLTIRTRVGEVPRAVDTDTGQEHGPLAQDQRWPGDRRS